MERNTGKLVVLVTCGSRSEARKIARLVVKARLGACVNILSAPVESVYRWKGKVESANEFLLVMKTTNARFSKLRDAILKALEQTRYNKTAAARVLGMSFRALRYRIKKLGIE